MTDPGTADRTYIGPMAPELVEEIIAKVNQFLYVCITEHSIAAQYDAMNSLNNDAGKARRSFANHGRSDSTQSCKGPLRGGNNSCL